MLKLDRTKILVPASLAAPSPTVARHKTAAANYYSARSPWSPEDVSYDFKGYDADDVKNALRILSHAKCAYCESRFLAVGAREVEHYRPKGGVKEEAGWPGYWWLAYDWDNFLPTCRDCNKSLRQHIVTSEMTESEVLFLFAKKSSVAHGKGNQFRLRGVRAITENCDSNLEDPLLIDPCKKDPADHLIWDFANELALLQPKVSLGVESEYGAYTIATCALNRAPLVIDRLSVLRPLKVQRTKILEELEAGAGKPELIAAAVRRAHDLKSFSEKDQPYSQMVSNFVDRFIEELEVWLAAHP